MPPPRGRLSNPKEIRSHRDAARDAEEQVRFCFVSFGRDTSSQARIRPARCRSLAATSRDCASDMPGAPQTRDPTGSQGCSTEIQSRRACVCGLWLEACTRSIAFVPRTTCPASPLPTSHGSVKATTTGFAGEMPRALGTYGPSVLLPHSMGIRSSQAA
jgi:hypothetical protein